MYSNKNFFFDLFQNGYLIEIIMNQNSKKKKEDFYFSCFIRRFFTNFGKMNPQ